MKAEQFYKCGKLWEYSKHGNPISKLCRICRNPVNLNISSNLVQKNIFLTNLRHEFGRFFLTSLLRWDFVSELTSIKTVEKGSNNQEKAKISLVASHHLKLILSCSESLSLFIFFSENISFLQIGPPLSDSSSFILWRFVAMFWKRFVVQIIFILFYRTEQASLSTYVLLCPGSKFWEKNQRLSPLSLVLVFFVQINFPMFPLQCSPLIVGKGQAGSEEDLSCTKSTAGCLILYFLYL